MPIRTQRWLESLPSLRCVGVSGLIVSTFHGHDFDRMTVYQKDKTYKASRVRILRTQFQTCTFITRLLTNRKIHRHFACCLGDTLASELGILSTSPPILITTLRRVPPGTNGGISALGTGASLLGGVIMGITVAITLLLENRACRNEWASLLLETSAWGAAAGLFGSFVRT